MKITTIILAGINSVPLLIYLFIAFPLFQILQQDAPFGDDFLTQFFGLGFAWATLLYPLVLLFNHTCCFLNYRKRQFKAALWNQIIMAIYVSALVIYGSVSFMFISTI